MAKAIRLSPDFLDSEIWHHPENGVRLIYITGLLLARPIQRGRVEVGFVDGNARSLIHRANIPYKNGLKSLGALCGEVDPSFRYVERVDKGFILPDFSLHVIRDLTAAERMRRMRARKEAA